MKNIEKIYTENVETVRKYLFCLTHNDDIAEELTQETFYRAIRKINSFKNNSKISTWLCQIAKNLWFDELKKNRKVLDEHERSPEHLKNAEEAYIELSEMYNWKRIECVKDGQIRDVEDINDDILKAIIKVG